VLLALLAGLLPAGSGNAAAQNGTFRLEYFPPNGGYELCDKEPFPPEVGVVNPAGKNFGAACLEVNGSKTAQITKVEDDLSPDVSLSWYFLDESWTEVGKPSLTEDPVTNLTVSGGNNGQVCNSTTVLSAPAGAKYFYVFLKPLATTALDQCDAGAFASHGFITIKIANK
jgi:hypothetical protein